MKGIEGGVKTTLLDRTLRLNINAYRYEFSDLQVDFFNASKFTFITTNAGSASTEGLEIASEYLPPAVVGLKLQASVQYDRARYQNYIGPCYVGETQAQGCDLLGPAPDFANLQNLDGKPTADAPTWTGMLGADYSFTTVGRMLFDMSVTLRFSSSYSVSPFAEPLDVQPSYRNVDATMRLITADHHWQLALIGKNLTNNFVVTSAFDEPSTGTAAGGKSGVLADQFALFSNPRTVELQLTYRH